MPKPTSSTSPCTAFSALALSFAKASPPTLQLQQSRENDSCVETAHSNCRRSCLPPHWAWVRQPSTISTQHIEPPATAPHIAHGLKVAQLQQCVQSEGDGFAAHQKGGSRKPSVLICAARSALRRTAISQKSAPSYKNRMGWWCCARRICHGRSNVAGSQAIRCDWKTAEGVDPGAPVLIEEGRFTKSCRQPSAGHAWSSGRPRPGGKIRRPAR